MAEARLNIRIDEKIKNQAEEVFHKLGLNMSTGITIYLTRVAALQGIPFPLTLEKPSEISKKADISELLSHLNTAPVAAELTCFA